jgi:hypothetical protein
MYKLHRNSFNEISIVIRDDGNGCFTSIPFDPANTDYQQYLKWVEAGNQPEPADE